jgi:hypothetical protein
MNVSSDAKGIVNKTTTNAMPKNDDWFNDI